MKRWLVIIALLLVGGVVVNVGVAWVGTVWFYPYTSIHGSEGIPLRPIEMPSDWEGDSTSRRTISRLLESKKIWWWRDMEPGSTTPWRTVQRVSTSWPMRSLSRTIIIVVPNDGTPSFGLWPEEYFDGGLWILGWQLPIRPIWPGFAINTLFYAMLLAIPTVGRGYMRRIRRLKRGLCVKCEYDLRGTDEGKLCPECGSERRRT